MKFLRIGRSLLCAAIAATTFAVASPAAALTTLDFSGNICGAAGTGACSNSSTISNYGDSSLIDVSYRSIYATGGNSGTTYQANLHFWGTYGDLSGVVWGGANRADFTSEIVFKPTAGYEVSLIGFDLATYLGRSTSSPFKITSLGGNSLFNETVSTNWPDHNSVTLNSTYFADGIVLQWGPDGYDVGLDNISFDVRAITSAVPEPEQWAMLIVGFGLVGGVMRKQRQSQAPATV